ncbi:ABC transporter permease [Candidatus Bathyarchaeota archaeon]|nr:ABC transporter permease [Candidatus Bathyarchaeota archaeon]
MSALGSTSTISNDFCGSFSIKLADRLKNNCTWYKNTSLPCRVPAKTIIIQHKGEINILRSIGASKKLLKRDLLIKLLPCSVISSSIGVALAIAALTIIQECGCLKILSHAASFQIDPLVIILNIILVFLLISAIILRSEAEI